MAPISSITEPIIRAVRNLTHAFIPLSIPSKLATRLDSLERLTSSSGSSLDHPMQKRQNGMVSIPATYAFLDTSPTPGTVVGIVLGTVAGIIIALLVVYQILGFGDSDESVVVVEERRNIGVARTGSRRSAIARPVSNRSGGRRVVEEMVEVQSRPASRRRHEPVEDEDEDVVVVEEEETTGTHYSDEFVEVEEGESSVATSPPRRRRRSGSYRRVDPLAYGDGDESYRRAR
ncbi:hypothetical protein UA08_08687 [Talaromyces atroroseus]|uniref:Uncharacterized protein n=1 Tax=Talaromyces atroroseus TaxID=1441469 RepID=A0A225ADS0_TALAT|nr:hypothetical protein UA08_08687 [Talaromyces atroroseus]OKL56104.1 hypothetical protein UA08_08687 [Talaromyces atroroseus]